MHVTGAFASLDGLFAAMPRCAEDYDIDLLAAACVVFIHNNDLIIPFVWSWSKVSVESVSKVLDFIPPLHGHSSNDGSDRTCENIENVM